MRSMPSAARAKQKYRPSRLRLTSETTPKALSTGTPTTARAASTSAVRSLRKNESEIFIAAFRRKQARGLVLQEENHQAQQHHLGVHALQEGLQELVERTDAEAGDHRAGQLAHAAGHHHHEGVHDVILP